MSLTNVTSSQTTYGTDYINKSTRKQPDIGHQISGMLERFEQLLGITADCKCCSRKYREKMASSRVNRMTETTEFVHNVFKEGNT